MSSDIHINNPIFVPIENKIRLNEQQLRYAATPVLNTESVFNAANQAKITLKSFGIPMLQTEIYKGRIPIPTPDKSPFTRKTKLGTAIFSDLQFSEINGLKHIPVDCVLYNVNQAKNIVRTQILGRDGQIKEYVGLDDYEINIKGVICGDNGVYPWDQVINLVKFFRYDQSLGITSRFLNDLFDITEVVVKDFAFEQSEGSQSYQKFEVNLWSEKPLEILIQEGK